MTTSREEVCISYDLKTKSIALYSVANKNRHRYNLNNFERLPEIIQALDSRRVIFHWPRYAYPVRTFVENIRYLNKASSQLNERTKELELRLFWSTLWNQMSEKALNKMVAA